MISDISPPLPKILKYGPRGKIYICQQMRKRWSLLSEQAISA
jgi:hypothetical protein